MSPGQILGSAIGLIILLLGIVVKPYVSRLIVVESKVRVSEDINTRLEATVNRVRKLIYRERMGDNSRNIAGADTPTLRTIQGILDLLRNECWPYSVQKRRGSDR